MRCQVTEHVGPNVGFRLPAADFRVPFSRFEIQAGPDDIVELDEAGRAPRLPLKRVVSRAAVERLRRQGRLPLWRDNP